MRQFAGSWPKLFGGLLLASYLSIKCNEQNGTKCYLLSRIATEGDQDTRNGVRGTKVRLKIYLYFILIFHSYFHLTSYIAFLHASLSFFI